MAQRHQRRPRGGGAPRGAASRWALLVAAGVGSAALVRPGEAAAASTTVAPAGADGEQERQCSAHAACAAFTGTCCPTLNNVTLACCAGKVGRFDGVWTTDDDAGGQVHVITGDTIMWEADLETKIEVFKDDPDAFYTQAENDQEPREAKLVGNDLVWNTGETWTRWYQSEDDGEATTSEKEASSSETPSQDGRATTSEKATTSSAVSSEDDEATTSLEKAATSGTVSSEEAAAPPPAATRRFPGAGAGKVAAGGGAQGLRIAGKAAPLAAQGVRVAGKAAAPAAQGVRVAGKAAAPASPDDAGRDAEASTSSPTPSPTPSPTRSPTKAPAAAAPALGTPLGASRDAAPSPPPSTTSSAAASGAPPSTEDDGATTSAKTAASTAVPLEETTTAGPSEKVATTEVAAATARSSEKVTTTEVEVTTSAGSSEEVTTTAVEPTATAGSSEKVTTTEVEVTTSAGSSEKVINNAVEAAATAGSSEKVTTTELEITSTAGPSVKATTTAVEATATAGASESVTTTAVETAATTGASEEVNTTAVETTATAVSIEEVNTTEVGTTATAGTSDEVTTTELEAIETTTAEAPVTTMLAEPVSAGSTELQVESDAGFSVGDKVTIEGGGISEVATVAGIGSLMLAQPTEHSFPAGSTVTRNDPAAGSDPEAFNHAVDEARKQAEAEAAAAKKKRDGAIAGGVVGGVAFAGLLGGLLGGLLTTTQAPNGSRPGANGTSPGGPTPAGGTTVTTTAAATTPAPEGPGAESETTVRAPGVVGTMVQAASVGATSIQVSDESSIEVSDVIRLCAGKADKSYCEAKTVVGFGSVQLNESLRYGFPPGSTVEVLEGPGAAIHDRGIDIASANVTGNGTAAPAPSGTPGAWQRSRLSEGGLIFLGALCLVALTLAVVYWCWTKQRRAGASKRGKRTTRSHEVQRDLGDTSDGWMDDDGSAGSSDDQESAGSYSGRPGAPMLRQGGASAKGAAAAPDVRGPPPLAAVAPMPHNAGVLGREPTLPLLHAAAPQPRARRGTSYSEVSSFMAFVGQGQKRVPTFDEIDLDGDGLITRDEWVAHERALQAQGAPVVGAHVDPRRFSPPAPLNFSFGAQPPASPLLGSPHGVSPRRPSMGVTPLLTEPLAERRLPPLTVPVVDPYAAPYAPGTGLLPPSPGPIRYQAPR